MNNTTEAYEKRKAAVLAEQNNPVAMPTPFGYIREETLNDILKEYEDEKRYKTCSHDEAEFFHKAREAARFADSLSKQVGGTHYKKGVQPWTIALDWGLDPWSHNVVKYILRFPYKNGKEDLEKIQHYLDFLIENYDEVNNKYYK
jgi:hypothetical protein